MSSLDDIDYMLEHAETQEFLLFIDSARRNKMADKTPSEYQVNFDIPFYNVCGIDVLDTTIPRTQYLLDYNNNTMAFDVDGEGWTRFEVDPGDYNITQLSDTLEVGLAANDKPIYVTPLSDPIDVKGQLKFTSTYPFTLNMSKSSMRGVLGFANPVIQSEAPYYYDTLPGYKDGDDDVFVANIDTGNVNYVSAFEGPSPVTSMLPLTQNPTCQLFRAAQTDKVIKVEAALGGIGTPAGNSVHFDIVDATGAVYSSGDMNVLLDPFNSYSVCNAVVNPANLVVDHPYFLSFTTLAADVGNTWGVYYAQPSVPQTTVPGVYTVDGPNDWANLTSFSDVTQQLCCKVQQGGAEYRIVAPGLYNLTGERYIIVRCREIEDHLYSAQSFTNNYNMGLTKVQLGIYGYGENRYDFSGVKSRTFHPISKLKKMTLRFERADGSLYDFKGIDHTLTLKIKYYATKRKPLTHHILNPNYNPNLLEYQKQNALEAQRKHWQSEYDKTLTKLPGGR